MQRTDSSAHDAATPLVRVDAMALALAFTDVEGTRYAVAPAGPVTAATVTALPVFQGWASRGTLTLQLRGQASAPFAAQLDVGGARLGPVAQAQFDPATGDYLLDLAAPLAELRSNGLASAEGPVKLGIVVAPGLRVLNLTRVTLAHIAGPAAALGVFDVREATDSILFNAPERKLFDLQNPEEGFWVGTGVWRLRVTGAWSRPEGHGTDAAAWSIDPRPLRVSHNHHVAGDATDVLYEDAAQRDSGPANTHTYLELYLDTSHRELAGKVAPEGTDVPVALTLEHTLAFGPHRARLTWQRTFGVRLRDPAPLIHGYKRLSAVGIDFGTTATVAAFTHRGFRSLMRLGSPPEGSNPAENPTYLFVEDHEKLWAELAAHAANDARFPHLVRLVQASHSAKEKLADFPNAVIAEIKSLPERVILLDQSPQLRDRRQADFLLDEPRVRMLVRAYAYLLGRAINRPGQDVYLQYWLTYPAEFDERARALLEEELRAGILLSIPQGINAAEVVVGMRATEPEAYAAEVCPELVNHPAIEPLVNKYGELRFAVFDFGGGTLDIACGRYRPATDAEQAASGCSSVIETLQVAGNDHLGGDYLTHELAWLVHQHDTVLPEMESREVPMQRPQTIPENKLAKHPQLYKRSLAARQNKLRFERELGLEQLKFKRANELARPEALRASRLDGTEVAVESLKGPQPALREKLARHLEERIEDGARLLASMLAGTAWGGAGGAKGNWREQGVVILLAGNSSRSEYVERAVATALDVPELAVWRPDDPPDKLNGLVLYETGPRFERGVEILGVTPKTAVALGALKIANREVHLVRAAQGFSYYVGDMKGFPPKFSALIAMGAPPANPEEWGPHYVEFGTWDAHKPLRVSTEYDPGKMTSNDPRLLTIPTGLPPGSAGKLFVCVVSPTRINLHLALPDGEKFVRAELNLAPYLS